MLVGCWVMQTDEKGELLTWRMHHHAHDKPADGTARQMQRRTHLQEQLLYQPPHGKEVRRNLHRAAEPRADHGGADAAVQAPDALGAEYLAQPVDGVAVRVLRAHGQGGGEALQARL